MGIINDIWSKCKKEWFTGLVLILTALLAFGLGRLSALTPTKTPMVIQPASTVPTVAAANNPTNFNLTNNKINVAGKVVASKEGSKYHLPECGGAKRIKPENLISFESVAAAQAAGYAPAANCPGL